MSNFDIFRYEEVMLHELLQKFCQVVLLIKIMYRLSIVIMKFYDFLVNILINIPKFH